MTEYLIIVLAVAVIVLIAVKAFGGGIFGEFQSAKHAVDSVGSRNPAAPASQGEPAGEPPSQRSVASQPEPEPAEPSGSNQSQTEKKSELDNRIAGLRNDVGDSESRVVDTIEINYPLILFFGGLVIAFGVYSVMKLRDKAKGGKRKKGRRFTLGGRGGEASSVAGGETESGEEGQVLVIGLFVCVGLMMAAISVANIGMMVAEKIQLQDTVDASAYSAAVAEARYMNLSAYINRAMIANYDMMAFDTSLWAVMDADDHGMAVIISLLYQIDAVLIIFPFTTAFGTDLDTVIDDLQEFVHHPIHTLNSEFNDILAQDSDSKDLNQYLEIYNTDILTMYQGLLYAAMQSSRYEVEREVAKKMDKDVLVTSVLGLGAEAVSYDELARAVDYVIKDPKARSEPFESLSVSFNDMAGKPDNEDDNPLLLAAVTEASLDRFAAGRTRDGTDDMLRSFNFGHIIPFGALETALDIECDAEEIAREASPLALFTDPLNCNADINLVLGASMREGFEDKHDQQHVPFIARRRMREVNFFGIEFKVSGTDGIIGGKLIGKVSDLFGARGHTSGDTFNDVGNVANSTPGPKVNIPRAQETVQLFGQCAIGTPIPSCGLNSFNIMEASEMVPVPLIPPIAVDDHWDGSFKDVEPVKSYQLLPPLEGNATVIEYAGKIAANGTEKGVPKYDWKVDLDNVGFPNYIYPTTGAEQRPNGTKGGDKNNLLTGPSIAVVGVKPQEKINGLQGLGIGNPYAMTAISRAQVYYVRNPNRPDELPSLFNPHWVARLAPIEANDTPELLKDGLPYVGSIGLPMDPTH